MYERKVSFCNISDECKTSPDFDIKDVLVWMFRFMTMMAMMMVSCIGQCTCTFGKIFRKGAESCSKRIRRWLPACSFIECCRMIRPYSFVVYDGRFTQFQVFRNSYADYVDICSDTECCRRGEYDQ